MNHRQFGHPDQLGGSVTAFTAQDRSSGIRHNGLKLKVFHGLAQGPQIGLIERLPGLVWVRFERRQRFLEHDWLSFGLNG
jgi:hypothetical protein